MSARGWLVVVALGCASASAQERPSEADLFGADVAADAGQARPSEADLFAEVDAGAALAAEPGDAGADRDSSQLGQGPIKSRFDTDETKSDPLKVGGSVLMTLQGLFLEEQLVEKAAVSAPMVLDVYLDARPDDRVRAYAVGRVQYDPTRPVDALSTQTGSADGGTAGGGFDPSGTFSTLGVTGATRSNPSVFLDQLWLRFDIERRAYLTIGRQKVRWGVSRIWYPTDFLNSQPRDALNPFDVRLGVSMVKVHVPVESLGWNFYGYGIIDNIAAGATGLTVERLGGALRAELVLGPAELGLGGVWLKGRRPRYAVDVSTPLGPVDVYAEAAFRDGRDFVKYTVPDDLTVDNFLTQWLLGKVSSHRLDGVLVQASGGVSYQFNYTDKNFAVIAAEYFYNPAGYADPREYLVQSFMPSVEQAAYDADRARPEDRRLNLPPPPKPDPSQRVPLYGGKHYLALIASAPGLPELPWISVSVSNIVNVSDPSGLVRIDASFRVLTYLTVQAFAAFFYGQSGGELRFELPDSLVKLIPDAPATLGQPPLAQVGVLLRLSI